MPKKRASAIMMGKYTLVEQIAEGGYGEVWAGAEPSGDRVAIKLIRKPKGAAAVDSARRRFEDETQAGLWLKDPHICAMLDFGEEAGRPELGYPNGLFYLVLEYVEGGSLQDVLTVQTALPAWAVPPLARALCSALQKAHTHTTPVVHRDIKPANVLLPFGDFGAAKLADFGISRARDDTRLTQTGVSVGTTVYMAPEHAMESWSVTAAADQYSLALMLWECLTGRLPDEDKETTAMIVGRVQGMTLPDLVVAEISAARTRAVFERALAKAPENRFPNVREFVDALLSAGDQDGLWDSTEQRSTAFDPSRAALVIVDHRTATGGSVWVAGRAVSEEILAVLFGERTEWSYVRSASELGGRSGWRTDSEDLLMPWEAAAEDEETAEETEDEADDDESDGEIDNAAFMAKLTPSPALAKIIGPKPIARTEVIKKLWEYIVKHGLQDQKNRRMINADAKLKVVFGGKERVSMFDMTKLVSKHLA